MPLAIAATLCTLSQVKDTFTFAVSGAYERGLDGRVKRFGFRVAPAVRVPYQPSVPCPPLNGPMTSLVIQPP